MKVKNGMASSVSFDMMPQTRSGNACRNVGVEQVEFDAEDGEAQPDEGEREGDRVADEQETIRSAVRRALVGTPR